jgi:hypothetical protein
MERGDMIKYRGFCVEHEIEHAWKVATNWRYCQNCGLSQELKQEKPKWVDVEVYIPTE